MSIVSMSQFKGIIEGALQYDPRRDRLTHDSMSGELFEGVGNTINAVRLKFLIEDDGGTWDGVTIAKPSFIWDLVKISAQSVIDDGPKRADLHIYTARETDDGLEFLETNKSYIGDLSGDISISVSDLNWKNTVFSCWFTPEELQSYQDGTIISAHKSGSVKFYAGIHSDLENPTNFGIRVYISTLPTENIIDRIVYGTSVMPLVWGKKYHLTVVAGESRLAVIINGVTLYDEVHNAIPDISNDLSFIIGYRYKGEISYMTLYANQWFLSDTTIEAYWKYGYPLPRKPEMVDLSDYFETKGKNLLLDVGNISKAIENLKGQLYVKTNTVKLRS